jgi:hypothetical protein
LISHAFRQNSARRGTTVPKIEYLRFTLAFPTLLPCGSIDERIQAAQIGTERPTPEPISPQNHSLFLQSRATITKTRHYILRKLRISINNTNMLQARGPRLLLKQARSKLPANADRSSTDSINASSTNALMHAVGL